MEYQFIEFTKNIINNYKNRSYLILNETIESNFTSLWTVINTNIIDFIKDPIIECLINTYHDLKNSNQINGTNRNERINYFFDIDTFNKLGYKTKINTHTTSCINLFLDIYLYSEYRLIYC